MTLSRLLALLLGLVALAPAFYVCEEYIWLLGFPDGYVTELVAAEKRLAVVFIGLSLPLGLYLLCLAGIAGTMKVGARLAVVASLYMLVLIGTMVVDHYLRVRLDGGIGG